MKTNVKIYGEDYVTKVPFEIWFNRIKIKRVKADKHTVYCYFDNIKDVLNLDKSIDLPDLIKNDLESIFNSNEEATIGIRQYYLNENIDIELWVDSGELELWYSDEFSAFGDLPAMLVIKVDKWLKENKHNITLKEIVKEGKMYELES